MLDPPLIIRIFISNDYIIVREQIIVKFNHFFTTNQTGTNFNVSWVLYLSRHYFSIKRSLETTLSQISWVFYRSGTELHPKVKVSTALTHIFWVLYWSRTNCIAEGEGYRWFYYTFSEFLIFWAIRNKF